MSRSSLFADFISRVNNARMVNHSFVVSLKSNLIKNCLDILLEEGYINLYSEITLGDTSFTGYKVDIKYSDKGIFTRKSIISEFKIISKPGGRVYVSANNIPMNKNGLGIYILSTSKGVMSDKKARSLNVGGELLCSVF